MERFYTRYTVNTSSIRRLLCDGGLKMGFFSDISTAGNDLTWISNNAFLIFGIILLIILIIIAGIWAVH